ncbi:MAG TPA: MFS transporter, partial [Acidimicrobiales bacterium]|nr:MFS transporter [Acidimicrobiales bacterium]
RWLLAILLAAPFMAQADATIVNVAVPSIHADLGASGAELELVVGGYIVTYAMLLITGARLGQTHGYRRIFLLGVVLFAAASLLAGLAPDPAVLIGARVVQGAGAGLMFPQALTGIQLNFSGSERTRAIGLYAIALSAGAVTGQVLGGILIAANIGGSAWRSIFFVTVPVGAVVMAAGWLRLPTDDRRAERRVDLLGVAILSAAILAILVPLTLGRPEGWPAWTWVCLAASIPATAVFVAAERRLEARGGAPLISISTLARPATSWALLAVALATGTYYALLFTLALYLQQGLGRSPIVSGLVLVPWVAAFGLAGQVTRRLPPELKPLVAPSGCLLLSAAYVTMGVSLMAGTNNEALLVVLLGLGGLGLGAQFNSIVAHLTNNVSPRYAPDISGVSTTFMQIGGAMAVAAVGTLYLALAAQPDSVRATNAFAVVSLVLAAVAMAAAAAARRATHRVSDEPWVAVMTPRAADRHRLAGRSTRRGRRCQ